jgi:hypothetical protein
MATTQSQIHSAEIREVQAAFERWRSSKRQGRELIPPKLWRMSARLCETYSINRVARRLGLNYTALKTEVDRRLHRLHPKPGRRGDPAFVELTPGSVPAGIIPGSSMVEYVVEAPARRDGTPRIHVRGASVSEVTALVRALRDNGDAA